MRDFFSRLSLEKIVLSLLLIFLLFISIPIFSHESYQGRVLGRYSFTYTIFLALFLLIVLGAAGSLIFLPPPKIRALSRGFASHNLFLLITSLIVTFLLGEGITRFAGGVGACGMGDPACWNKHRKINIFNISPGGCVRPREYPYEKGGKVFRIIGLGDSFTFGQGVDLTDTYLKKLEVKLNQNSHSLKYEVINTGHCGLNTVRELGILKSEGMKYGPDLIIIGYCLNDSEIESYQLKRLLPQRIERLLKWSYFYFFVKYRVNLVIMKILHDKNYDYYLNLYPPNNEKGWEMFVSAMNEIGRIGRGKNIPVLLVIIPLMENFEKYKYARAHQQVAEVGKESGMIVLDLLPDFIRFAESIPDYGPALLLANPSDGHPGIIAHQIISEAIFQTTTGKHLVPVEKNGGPDRASPLTPKKNPGSLIPTSP